ncbi:GGDEF domain-containing protein [Kurthia senegalensis]|uniref:GGDEF domain-containing protein n=1 Tax=Kurthia senegalensis TaxID=1033740 RepID=UPI0002890164|nr:GGDEF domain-containing protein [Kurthia senegalensis]
MEVLSTEQQQVYFQMAEQLEYEGDLESAEEIYTLVMSSAFDVQDFPLYIENALRIMSIDVELRKYDDAYSLTEIVKDSIEQYASKEQMIIFENIRLSVRHHLQLEGVIAPYERLLQSAYASESIQQIINVGNNLMDCYLEKGYVEDAIVLIESMKYYVEDSDQLKDSMGAFSYWINFYNVYLDYENVEKMHEALLNIEQLTILERMPRLIYRYWAAKAFYALMTDSYEVAKYYFQKAYHSNEHKHLLIPMLEKWLQLIQERQLMQDVIYFQTLLIEALKNKVMKEDNVHRGRMIAQMSNVALERKMHIDRLTGVKNRTYYEELLDKKWHVTQYTFAIFDIDRFKSVNDNYGHLVGDQAIKWLASIANEWKPFPDIDVVRYGGDEFIIMSPHPVERMIDALESLREYVMNQYFLIRDTGEKIKLTISIGACYATDEAATMEELFKQADVALYEAKRSGRNQLLSYSYKKEPSKSE